MQVRAHSAERSVIQSCRIAEVAIRKMKERFAGGHALDFQVRTLPWTSYAYDLTPLARIPGPRRTVHTR